MVLVSLSCAILALSMLQTGIITHARADAQCYYRDGTPADSSSFKPCYPDRKHSEHSACCSTEKTNDARPDICLENGLCYVQDSYNSGMVYMDACTDKEWDSTKCPSFCDSVDEKNDAYAMIPCPSKGRGFWCCSEKGEDCCESASSISMAPLLTTGLAMSTSPALSSPTTIPTPTSTGTSEQCDGLSKATSVGAGVGVSLGVCLLAMSAGLVFQNFAHKKRLQSLKNELGLRMAEAEPMKYGQGRAFQPPCELENTQQAFELWSQRH